MYFHDADVFYDDDVSGDDLCACIRVVHFRRSLAFIGYTLIPKAHELFDFDEKLFGSDIVNGVGLSDACQFTLRLTFVVEI
ncbi:hypothetical protein MTR_2g084685 [Medicago truncatula]|uniref:Uncharacterized protein n=1 Tax=Medicago truncatula TaxID=3880 RepID=A0A072VA90_MEDTR|nr:hypothetical protein MTR_2g084685 [Medicago truncatula]